MQKPKVALVRLKDYEPFNVIYALQQSLNLLGGLENIVRPGSSVFVKINLLSPESLPERAINTHAAFTKEVLLLLKEMDVKITVGDDIRSCQEDGFLASGYRQVCDELGVRIVNIKEAGFQETDCKGQLLEKTYISSLVLESDAIINLPKLKTHSLSVFTGAIKNMYGIIPHGLRLKYHRDFQLNEIFSQILVDIFSCALPILTIMDAVVAMEGEGPSSGTPRHVEAVLASKDAVALDAVASKIAGFNPLDIPSILNAHERGLGVGQIDKIDVVGEMISEFEIKDFKHSAIAVGLLRRRLPVFLYAYFQDQLAFTPKIIQNKCTGCWECVTICPRGAAKRNKDEESAWIDTNLCIHCMCCHEVCRFQAIKLKQRPFGHIYRGLHNFSRRLRS